MFKLAIIVGTDRPNSKSQLMAEYVKTLYVGLGVDAQIYSMAFFPLRHVVGGPYEENIPEVEEFIAPILASDALLFIIPEYNGSFPGILKMFIDYLPFPEAFPSKTNCLYWYLSWSFWFASSGRTISNGRQLS